MQKRSMNKRVRTQQATVVEAVDVVAQLEALIAEGLKDGTVKEGSRQHLELKRELRKTRDAINLARRRGR